MGEKTTMEERMDMVERPGKEDYEYEYECFEWVDDEGIPHSLGLWLDREKEELETRIMGLAFEVAFLVYKGLDNCIPLLCREGHPVDISFCLGSILPPGMSFEDGYKLDESFLEVWEDAMHFLSLLSPADYEDELRWFLV